MNKKKIKMNHGMMLGFLCALLMLSLFSGLKMVQAGETEKAENGIVVIFEEAGHPASINLDDSKIDNTCQLSEKMAIIYPEAGIDPDHLMKEIEREENVKAVLPDATLFTEELPDDAVFLAHDTSWFYQTGMDKTWNAVENDDSVKVAVIDTGCDVTHEDLAGRTEPVQDIYGKEKDSKGNDLSGHGTSVSGLIAAVTNNQTGIPGSAGLASVTIVPYRCGGKYENDKSISAACVAAALLDIAENRPDISIVNMSVGVLDDGGENVKNAIALLQEPIKEAVSAGKVLIAASGNEGAVDQYYYPACFDGVISVASVNQSNKVSSFSNKNNGTDFSMPGEALPLLHLEQSYKTGNGTSYASPILAGICAMLLADDPEMTGEALMDVLKLSAKDMSREGWNKSYGYGIVQADQALEYVRGILYDKGDITRDHVIDSVDALQVLRYSVREICMTGLEKSRGDVTVSGDVDSVDALQILRYSVKEINAF